MGTAQTGKKIGNYRIGEQIGGGAMGRVWRGVDEALGRPVAVKMLRTELAGRTGLIDRFRIEAQVLARLHHPNIAMVYALIEDGEDLYLVMEYVQGETLHTHLERRGPLDLDSCFPLFHQALAGIRHAHEAGVVHRDIKPSNLMLGPGGQVKWIDFGIAHVEGRERMTRTGGLMGTPEYMAPEQVRGGTGTVASDVYSLGILLYTMLTGESPFTGEGEFDVMRAQVENPPPRPSERSASIDEALEGVLLRALAKEPEERFETVVDFQEALVAAGAPEPVVPAAAAAGPATGGFTAVEGSDPGDLPPEPTVPDLDALEPWAEEVPPPATVPDLEALAEEETEPATPGRARRFVARAGTWLATAVLVVGFVAALNWLVDPRRTGPGAAAHQPQLPAIEAVPVEVASPESVPEPAPEAEASPLEPAPPPSPRRAAPAPAEAEGWEILR